MCGIAGFSGPFEAALLGGMGVTLAHRGPNDQGEIVLGEGIRRVGLAHRRLSIIDLSEQGHQPMMSRCERCGTSGEINPVRGLWLTFNGELYNYQELRRRLQAKGHRFFSQTDSEVLLHLYAEEGQSMFPQLNGMYAFAIYDGRRQNRNGGEPGDLMLARDAIGVKPLYFSETPKGFLFASELKALLQSEDVPRDIDPVAVHHYLAYLWAPAPRTMLKSVRKLPPGQALLVRDGRIVRQWSHYTLPYGQDRWDRSEASLAQELADRIEAAVERQMVADVPVGAFLSGGLDSSAVVAMMRRARPHHRPVCYVIGFKGGEHIEGGPDDVPYAQRAARHLDADLRVIEVGPDLIHRLEYLLYHLDEPQADPAPLHVLTIAEQARRDGIPVLLSGTGGDDLFSGYRRHVALKLERLWGWLPEFARRGLAHAIVPVCDGLSEKRWSRAPWVRRVRKAAVHAASTEDERLISYFHWSEDSVRRSLYTDPLAQALAAEETSAPLRASLDLIPTERDPLARMLYLETKHFLADHNLPYTDKASMAAGIEVRVPLVDVDLVEFAARLPSHLKINGVTTKSIFRKAMEPFLPREVIYRPKTGFGAPLRRWIHHELGELVEDVLQPSSLNARGLFDATAVRQLMQADRAGRVDGAYLIYAVICIELWCRLFLDPPPSVPGKTQTSWIKGSKTLSENFGIAPPAGLGISPA
ncbi:MAG TPA: asparagine synthase (glutamine-hydrolyzing) [Bacteroidota bacterium]|nr:asparagine synthase (glutamine-hydrolyzing) [Bacteroidota bacterium]